MNNEVIPHTDILRNRFQELTDDIERCHKNIGVLQKSIDLLENQKGFVQIIFREKENEGTDLLNYAVPVFALSSSSQCAIQVILDSEINEYRLLIIAHSQSQRDIRNQLNSLGFVSDYSDE